MKKIQTAREIARGALAVGRALYILAREYAGRVRARWEIERDLRELWVELRESEDLGILGECVACEQRGRMAIVLKDCYSRQPIPMCAECYELASGEPLF